MELGEEPGVETPGSTAVRARAASEPERLLVEDDVAPLSYGELDRRADAVAAALLDRLGPGVQPVPVLCEELRSLVVADLGICRAGKMASILDPHSPEARLATMLDDLGSPLVLTDGRRDGPDATVGGRPALPVLGCPPAPQALPRFPAPEVMMIPYTSGSTGVPKGVMQPRANREATVEVATSLGDLSGVRLPYFPGIGWGMALVHAAAVAGATVIPYDVAVEGVANLPRWVRDRDINAMVAVPTLLRAFVSRHRAGERHRLRYVVSYGETLYWSDVAALRRCCEPGMRLFNLFGLTESGFFACNTITDDTSLGTGMVRAGTILPGATVEIVDGDGLVAPAGVDGEIVVSSPRTMVGYWRRPELTADRLEVLGDGRRRLRTGDRGRLEPDGSLTHLGRLDHVVKVSGRRVELGEIEAALCSAEGVVGAAAATYDDRAGRARLAAFVVAEPSATLSPAGLRSGLARVLPSWMLPDRIVVVDELPALANGKVDRRSLPDLAVDAPGGGGDLVGSLVGLWSLVLDRGAVGPDDDFFELGGDSIRVAALFAAVGERLGFDRPPTLLFEHPTPRLLAEALVGPVDVAGEVVPFNVGGAGVPVVVVHDGAGEVLHARLLAEGLGGDRPVFAIRSAVGDGGAPLPGSVEALARRYVGLVVDVVGVGRPLRLVGSSFGGFVAFEMAVQLQRLGVPVDLVVLGDAVWPGSRLEPGRTGQLPPSGFRTRAALRRGDVPALLALGLEYGEARWSARGRRARLARLAALLDSGRPVPAAQRGEAALVVHGRVLQSYDPDSRFPGQAILVRATGSRDVGDGGWGGLVGGLSVVDADCDHLALCCEAGVPHLLAALRSAEPAAVSR